MPDHGAAFSLAGVFLRQLREGAIKHRHFVFNLETPFRVMVVSPVFSSLDADGFREWKRPFITPHSRLANATLHGNCTVESGQNIIKNQSIKTTLSPRNNTAKMP